MRLLVVLILTSQLVSAQWQQMANYPTNGFDDGVAIYFDSVAYVCTGLDAFYACLGDVWEYKIENDSWQLLGEFPGEKRQYASSVSLANEGFILGGLNCNGQSLSDVWKFNPGSGNWNEINPMPIGLSRPLVLSANDEIWVFGGRNGQVASSTVFKLNISTNTWQNLDSLPFGGRYDMVGFYQNNTFYMGLGTNQAYENNFDWWSYDFSNDSWQQLSNYPGKNSLYVAALSNGNTNIVCTGSDVKNTFHLESFNYLISTNSWTETPAIPANPFRGSTSFVLGNNFFFCGGLDSSLNRINTNWKYQNTVETDVVSVLYPNPAHDKICIQTDLKKNELKFFDSLGKETVISLIGDEFCFDVSDFKTGIHFIKIGNNVYKWVKI